MADPIHRHIAPLKSRIFNMVARAVVKLANDVKKQQLLQIDGFEGGPVDDAENFQPYGFSSVPLAGAEAVAVFPNGDRSHALVVTVADRRYRPTSGQPGEVTVYNHTGAKAVFKANGDIELHPASGRQVLVSDAGTPLALATKADIDALKTWAATHAHAGVTTGPGTSGTPAVAPPAASGTSVLKAQ